MVVIAGRKMGWGRVGWGWVGEQGKHPYVLQLYVWLPSFSWCSFCVWFSGFRPPIQCERSSTSTCTVQQDSYRYLYPVLYSMSQVQTTVQLYCTCTAVAPSQQLPSLQPHLLNLPRNSYHTMPRGRGRPPCRRRRLGHHAQATTPVKNYEYPELKIELSRIFSRGRGRGQRQNCRCSVHVCVSKKMIKLTTLAFFF